MTSTDLEDKVLALITPSDEELAEAYEKGELEYWDSGNFDDCFEQGVNVGFVHGILAAAWVINKQENN